MGLGMYNNPGEYYVPHTTSSVFLIIYINNRCNRKLYINVKQMLAFPCHNVHMFYNKTDINICKCLQKHLITYGYPLSILSGILVDYPFTNDTASPNDHI